MKNRIKENLSRQGKAMLLLQMLLEEEFSRLQKRDARGVTPMELSIQELMRQLVAEREDLVRVVTMLTNGNTGRLRDYLPSMPEEEREEVQTQLRALDEQEQRCARQAAQNQQVAMALFEQSSKLLDYMHSKVKPTKVEGYAANGRYASRPGESHLVRGTL
ncbi:FlgN protein [Paucidesulfovibrio gracilis DSM 16080]|jgi:flagellar biosynthesis/type III secretory pathway chaperone|uniref:FlgN protein n=1 Tax=Paucidesulfovibrio gracilis DSM 16080 TaxID=1121449 RepID=A0A1T4XAG0_9BACT|nr:flagellar export chaperone FlgN [Paucidesulfovibrio gracilis]SKA86566.1 FlgN protein [Paucidesulfovibrio gracilis DSM 16080]